MKNSKNKKLKMPLRKTLSHNMFMIRIIFSASPLFGVMLILNAIRDPGMNFVEHTIGINFVLESIEFGRDFMSVLRFLLLMLGLLAFSGLYSSVFFHFITPICRPKIEKKLKLILYEKAKELDLSCYDDPYYYNEFVLSVTESVNSVDRSVRLVDMTFQGLTLFFSYGTFFIMNDPVSVIFVLVSFTARFFISNILNKLQFKARLAETPFIRKRNYIHRVFYLNEYAKELRLNKDISKDLYRDFGEMNIGILRVRKSVVKKKWVLSFLNDYLFRDFITDGMYLTYLVYKTAAQRVMSFSTMVVMYNSAGWLRRGMVTLSDLFPYAVETALYVEKIRTFLDYDIKIISRGNKTLLHKPAVIRFEDVSFSYTENGENILNHVSLTINPFEKSALVGYNGAGKTTLVKLLMRLYDPTEGRITLDGTDIREFDIEEYRNRIGTVFQDFRVYAATVEENIIMDLSSEKTLNNEKMETALINSGFIGKFHDLENGTKTQITREFDDEGTSLSGGESQKLAVARVFYKEADMIILDEPSSALDPIAEYQLNHSMAEAANDKTVVFISHRLSTTRHADRIFMLEKGCLIEAGTHDQLINKNGKYAEMWRAQASKYVY